MIKIHSNVANPEKTTNLASDTARKSVFITNNKQTPDKYIKIELNVNKHLYKKRI